MRKLALVVALFAFDATIIGMNPAGARQATPVTTGDESGPTAVPAGAIATCLPGKYEGTYICTDSAGNVVYTYALPPKATTVGKTSTGSGSTSGSSTCPTTAWAPVQTANPAPQPAMYPRDKLLRTSDFSSTPIRVSTTFRSMEAIWPPLRTIPLARCRRVLLVAPRQSRRGRWWRPDTGNRLPSRCQTLPSLPDAPLQVCWRTLKPMARQHTGIQVTPSLGQLP